MGWTVLFVWLSYWTKGDGPFLETRDHWWSNGYLSAMNRKIVTFYPEDGMPHREPSRFEAAVYFHAISVAYSRAAESYLTATQKIATEADSAKLQADRQKLLDWGDRDAYFRRGYSEFYSLLHQLGASVDPNRIERLRRRVLAVSPMVNVRHAAFSDVPKNHWAAQALRELRAAELLDGYPSNRFGG